MRRSLLIGAVLTVVLLATGCEAVRPPQVGVVRRAQATRYEPDAATSGLLVAGEGSSHVAIWSTADATLQMDRFEGSVPVGAPTTLDRNEDPSALEMEWFAGSAAVGNGSVLASFEVGIGGAHGLDERFRKLFLVAPDGRMVDLHGGPERGLGFCTDLSGGWGVANNEVAWNGSTFLVAMGCETSTRLFRVSTGGAIVFAATLPAVDAIALASAADHFLLVYSQSDGDYAPIDVEAQRVASDGRLVGGPVALDRFRADRTDLTAAASNGAYLAAWTVTGEDQYPDLASRTVHLNGSLGGTRVLSDDPGPQVDPTLVGGSGGSWFAAWTDPYGSYLDVFGTKVAADGTVAVEDGRPLASLPPSSSIDPGLTRGPSGTAHLTSIRVGFGARLGVTRKLDSRGTPSGSSFPASRVPARQDCRDVAGGRDRFLVTWHETSLDGDTDLFAQRYRPDGTREGPTVTVSSAPGDQRCPTAAGTAPVGSSSGPTVGPANPTCSARSCRAAARCLQEPGSPSRPPPPTRSARPSPRTGPGGSWRGRIGGTGMVTSTQRGWPSTGCWTPKASPSPEPQGTRAWPRWQAPMVRPSSYGWEITRSNGGCCVRTARSSAGSCRSVPGTRAWPHRSRRPVPAGSRPCSRTGWSTPTHTCSLWWTRAPVPPPGG